MGDGGCHSETCIPRFYIARMECGCGPDIVYGVAIASDSSHACVTRGSKFVILIALHVLKGHEAR